MSSLLRVAASGIVVLLIGGFGPSHSYAADTVPRGELLASMCDSCHGANGKGAAPMPAISGMDAEIFVVIMQALANGSQPTSIMDRHATGYTEAELKAIAEHYSKQ